MPIQAKRCRENFNLQALFIMETMYCSITAALKYSWEYFHPALAKRNCKVFNLKDLRIMEFYPATVKRHYIAFDLRSFKIMKTFHLWAVKVKFEHLKNLDSVP